MDNFKKYLRNNSLLSTDDSILKNIFTLQKSKFEELVYYLLDSNSDQARVNGCMLCTLYPDLKRSEQLLKCTISITNPSSTIEGVVALIQILSPDIIALNLINYLQKPDIENYIITGVENTFYWLGITSASLSNRARFYYLLTQHSWVLSIVNQLNARKDKEPQHIYFPDLLPLSDEIIFDQFPYLAIHRVLVIPDWITAHTISLQILKCILKLFDQTISIQMKHTCVGLLNFYDFALLPMDFQEQIIHVYNVAQYSSDENLRYLVSTSFHQALINLKRKD